MGFSSSVVLATKITLPESLVFDSNVPLKIRVPNSRQQSPIGNSTSAEKLNRSLVVSAQAAGCVVVSGLESGAVSSSRKDPDPLVFASKTRFFSSFPANLNLTFQRPIKADSRDFRIAAEFG